MRIGEKLIGEGHPCYIIAEAGVNHNGSLKLARELVEAAQASGADAVKFQAFEPKLLASPKAQKADYQAKNLPGQESQLEMLQKLTLTAEEFGQLRDQCRQSGIQFLCTPFDEKSVGMLCRLGVEAFKLSSSDLTNLRLLRSIASLDMPMILSTGMANLAEVEEAVNTLAASRNHVALLHCVTQYPSPIDQIHLRAMDTMRQAFGLPTGYSDHTLGIEIALAAVARGAVIVEKHFTLDRNLPGPDHLASVEPETLAQMVSSVRNIELALGSPRKQPAPCEVDTMIVARRSIAVSRDLPAGHVLTAEDLIMIRPGSHISPAREAEIIGRKLGRAMEALELLDWKDFTSASKSR